MSTFGFKSEALRKIEPASLKMEREMLLSHEVIERYATAITDNIYEHASVVDSVVRSGEQRIMDLEGPVYVFEFRDDRPLGRFMATALVIRFIPRLFIVEMMWSGLFANEIEDLLLHKDAIGSERKAVYKIEKVPFRRNESNREWFSRLPPHLQKIFNVTYRLPLLKDQSKMRAKISLFMSVYSLNWSKDNYRVQQHVNYPDNKKQIKYIKQASEEGLTLLPISPHPIPTFMLGGHRRRRLRSRSVEVKRIRRPSVRKMGRAVVRSRSRSCSSRRRRR